MNETHEKFPALLGMTLNLNLKNVEMDIWSFEGEMFGEFRVVASLMRASYLGHCTLSSWSIIFKFWEMIERVMFYLW